MSIGRVKQRSSQAGRPRQLVHALRVGEADCEALVSNNAGVPLYANHVDTDILEDLVGGGHYSIEIQIWGEGPVQILRDGRIYGGRWVRRERNEMPSFVDDAGNLLPLKPGNSWLQLVPLGFPTTIQS